MLSNHFYEPCWKQIMRLWIILSRSFVFVFPAMWNRMKNVNYDLITLKIINEKSPNGLDHSKQLGRYKKHLSQYITFLCGFAPDTSGVRPFSILIHCTSGSPHPGFAQKISQQFVFHTKFRKPIVLSVADSIRTFSVFLL